MSEQHVCTLKGLDLWRDTKRRHGISKGRNETKILDEIEQRESIKIDRQFSILGYFPDGYCHETNTIYEVYEKKHDKQVQHDLERETEICNHLSCDFIIIWDKN